MQLSMKSNLLIILMMLVVVSMTMSNFLVIWVLMEITTLVFIFIMSADRFTAGVLSLKYFITQSFISMLLVISFLLIADNLYWFKEMLMSSLILWKLGVPPFQNWFMNMIMDSSWFVFFLISTLMKAIPFLLLSMYYSHITLLVSLLSVLAPAVSGVSQVCLKKIMGTSSMFTSGWVMFSMLSSSLSWLFVFILYSMLLLVFCLNMYPSSMTASDMSYFLTTSESFLAMFVLFSLSGIPPMSGFFMKIYILMSILSDGYVSLSIMIVLVSSLSVYMYIKTIFKYMTLSTLNQAAFSLKPSFMSLIVLLNMFSAIILYI
uniref:NADH-ubiquinone oxidoreductase chain 2 n=1 Tax=Sinergasilus undulatus TaxID=232572 RepID=A0A873A6T8_9MAXI|nr:NADH dehydrogenase subunit 2 [Sinergasilus undulatus]QOY46115.1 NADH dehydrogenase subunit 2 [Sinergasilus undulatus]